MSTQSVNPKGRRRQPTSGPALGEFFTLNPERQLTAAIVESRRAAAKMRRPKVQSSREGQVLIKALSARYGR